MLPVASIPIILQQLHNGHPGQDKTIKLANQLYYWPGMLNDIRTFVESCKLCFRRLPNQQHNPVITSPPSFSYGPPMAHVGLDLFAFGGKQHLLCVDHWSGFPLYKVLRSTNSQSVINVLSDWFNILGWPSVIRPAPNFRDCSASGA